MVAEERVIEVQGEDVESALEAGLAQLGLSRDDVIIEVLDEGSAGFLGIGGRDALVRLTTLASGPPGSTDPPNQEIEEIEGPAHEQASEALSDEVPLDLEPESPDEYTPEEGNEGQVAMEIINTLLQKMHVKATTSLKQTEPDDLTGERRMIIDIRGNDMGVLIGPRGETLNSLQYIARLMTGHVIHQRPKFIVDIEGYRARREQALSKLAERMADKVVSRGSSMSLEPMPPNERRIIHITLRGDDRVYTESSGEGRYRKVRIYLKE